MKKIAFINDDQKEQQPVQPFSAHQQKEKITLEVKPFLASPSDTSGDDAGQDSGDAKDARS